MIDWAIESATKNISTVMGTGISFENLFSRDDDDAGGGRCNNFLCILVLLLLLHIVEYKMMIICSSLSHFKL